jgi:hypothetical protein
VWANADAQENRISLPHVLSAAQEYLANSNVATSRYYLTTVEKKFRVTTSTRLGKDHAEEFYELWWVSAEQQRSRHLGLRIPPNGAIQRLSSPASAARLKEFAGTPRITLEKALRLSEAYAFEHSLATSTHYLHSANLVSKGRSAQEIYWCIRLRDGSGREEDDILLAVRMDGTVEQLYLT